jgi:hypothetical protein
LALPPGTTDEAFLREVDEELRRDQLLNIWRRWGRWIVAAVIGGLLVFGGVLYFRTLGERGGEKQGEHFDTAMRDLGQNQAAKAAPELEKLAASGTTGFRALARLVQADTLLQKNDLKGAAAKFAEVAGDKDLPQPFRDEALVRQTSAEFDQLKPEVVIERLKTLAVPDSAWFGSAGEMVAAAYLKQGKRDVAGKLYGQIAQTKSAVPDSIRERARQMAGSLGVDAIDQSKDNKAQ